LLIYLQPMKTCESETNFEQNIPETYIESSYGQGGWLCLFFIILILMSGGAALGLLMSPEHQISSDDGNHTKAKRIKISTVDVGMIEESNDFIASLEPLNSVILQTKVQGKVTHVFVKLGNKIQEGNAIIQINSQGKYSASSSYSYNQARQKLAIAQEKLNYLEKVKNSQIVNAQQNEQKYQKYSLLVTQGALLQQDKDEYANNLLALKNNIVAIKAKIQAQKVIIYKAKQALQKQKAYILTQTPKNIQRYKITAPLTGTITSLPVKVGDIINTSTRIATITQNHPLEVTIKVPEKFSDKLRKGIPVKVMDEQGKQLGKTEVYSIIKKDKNHKVIVVKALLKNTQYKTYVDQLVRTRLIFKERPGVLVPAAAIFRVAEDNFVYVVETKRNTSQEYQLVAKQRRVQLGNIRGKLYQVLGGLQAGEQIATSGLLNLRDGDRIIPSY